MLTVPHNPTQHIPLSLLDLKTIPDLSRLLGQLASMVERPVPLAQLRDELAEDYAKKSRTARLKIAQAFRELLAIAGLEAQTDCLTPELIARFSARAGRASTTNGLLASLHAGFVVGAKKGYLSATRIEECVWRIPPDAPRRRHHPRADILKVLDALRKNATNWLGWRLYVLAAIYCYTGLRRNEALILRLKNVDLERGFIWVSPNGQSLKTLGSQAPVPIPRKLGAILRSWFAMVDSEWLIPKVHKDGPWLTGAVGYRPADRLKAAGESVGVLSFTPQTLRHSLATHLAGHWGLSAKQIQLLLRHSRQSTTEANYIHPDLVNLGESVRDFDFSSPTTPAKSRPVPKRRFKRRMTSRPAPRRLA